MRKHRGRLRDPKMRIINVVFRRKLSEIKLKRTDTTLDLSQLAKRAGEEKKEEEGPGGQEIFISLERGPVHSVKGSVRNNSLASVKRANQRYGRGESH